MSTIALILAAMLICSIIAGGFIWYTRRQRFALGKPLSRLTPAQRKLSDTERTAVERYLASLARSRAATLPTGASSTQEQLVLTSLSNSVYPLTRAITRYGLSTDEPHKWRYYLDAVEVHLPPQWEQFITDENYIELIKTQTVPLIISLNGHTLTEYDGDAPTLIPTLRETGKNASIRKAESEQIELLSVRKETREEYALSRPEGTREALIIGSALLLFFFSLTGPLILMPWLITAGITMILVSCWSLFRKPAERDLREVHCLRGAPKRWGLFSESSQGQISNISLGNVDLIYPPYWQKYVVQDLGRTTEIDIYLNRHVVRQGQFLSLQDEVRNYPVQRWRKNVVLAACSLLVLALLITWVPLSMPLKLSMAWIKGTDSLEVTSVDMLEKTPLNVGDTLKIRGKGMCSIPLSYQSNRNYAFMPFDCSAIYWNNAPPLPLPQSDIIDRATALLDIAKQQLHPQTATDPKLNPQLATAIQKSGMILLDDFSDIVQKTQELCSQNLDCVRLKNALVNLGNAKDWTTLVRRADSGALNGMNVLLRPVSAEALENLIDTATSTFFYRETRRAAEALNSPPPGGFLIYSDEGRSLVSHTPPSISLFDYDAPEQWPVLQRLAGLLLHTPFAASGIVTSLSTDANGTRHITLHSEPNAITLWRYLGTSLLLVVLLLSLIINTLLSLHRMHKNRVRLQEIQRFYDSCFHHSLNTISTDRAMF